MALTHGSLFSGVGGFDIGADRAGIKTLWQCEIDDKCRSVLDRHWSGVTKYVDIKDVKGNEIKPVDIISFGSPCQDLSIAGKRKGLKGNRSGLFFEATRIIKEMREATNGEYPQIAIWENVKGALSSNQGKDFQKVIKEMAAIGALDISWRLLNAANFGTPQRRVRVFLIADFRGERAGKILSESTRLLWHPTQSKQKRKATTRKVTESTGNSSLDYYHEVSPTITAKWHKGNAGPAGNEVQNLVTYTENKRKQTDDVSQIVEETIYFMPHQEDGARVQKDTMGTLLAAMGTGGNTVPMVAEVFSKAKRAENKEDYESWKEGIVSPTLNAIDNTGDAFATVIAIQDARDIDKKQNGLGINDDAKVMYTLDTASEHAVVTKSIPTLALTDREGKPGGGKQKIAEPQNKTYKVRRLTPRECERLMGWDDDHTRYDNNGKEISDSARYKMCGNGISAPVAQWVCENVVKALSNKKK